MPAHTLRFLQCSHGQSAFVQSCQSNAVHNLSGACADDCCSMHAILQNQSQHQQSGSNLLRTRSAQLTKLQKTSAETRLQLECRLTQRCCFACCMYMKWRQQRRWQRTRLAAWNMTASSCMHCRCWHTAQPLHTNTPQCRSVSLVLAYSCLSFLVVACSPVLLIFNNVQERLSSVYTACLADIYWHVALALRMLPWA